MISQKNNTFPFLTFILCLCFITISANGLEKKSAQNSNNNPVVAQTARPEHIELNVPDPLAMIKWYTKNLEMIVIRQGSAPNYSSFIADSGRHMMLEIAHYDEYPPIDMQKASHMSLHLAFMVKDIAAVKEKLIAEKATVADDINTTSSGDKLLVLRDPWGFPIQFVERQNQMLKYSEMRPEHFQLNLTDSRAKADWYVENLGLKIVRKGGAPSFGFFISDANDNMMLELTQDASYPVLEFDKINYNSFHVAFVVDDVKAMRDKLISVGAKLAEEIKNTPAGDQVVMIRDPWGQAIQFVKRVNPMLK
jgi:glyoxylase I family protein